MAKCCPRLLMIIATQLLFQISSNSINGKEEKSRLTDSVLQDGEVSHLREAREVNQEDEWIDQKFQYRQSFSLKSFLNFTNFEKFNSRLINASTRCESDLYRMVVGVKTKQMWAINMLDSFGKPGGGILEGNANWPGLYSQCQKTTSQDNSTTHGPNYAGQHCNLVLAFAPRIIRMNPVLEKGKASVGVCIPDSCSSEEMSALINENELISFLEQYVVFSEFDCWANKRPHLKDAKVFIPCIIIGILIFLTATGTIYDLLTLRVHSSATRIKHHFNAKMKNPSNNCENMISVTEVVNCADDASWTKKDKPPSDNISLRLTGYIRTFLLAFSVNRNGPVLFKMSHDSGVLHTLNGIRFLSFAWIVVGHFFLIYASTMAVDNVRKVVTDLQDSFIQLAPYAVDSFFVLSGLLLTYIYLKKKPVVQQGMKFWIKFYVYRYCRLTPTFITVMFLVTGDFASYWLVGPFQRATQQEWNKCYVNWWKNILYISNFEEKRDKECMSHTWYLSVDMQLYFISPIFLIALNRSARLAGIVGGMALVASWITTGILEAQLNVSPYINVNTTLDRKFDDFQTAIYVKPYTRIGPYLVGMACGWLLFKTKKGYVLNKYWAILGWILTAAFNYFVLLTVPDPKPSLLYNVVRTALDRTAWGIGVCWVIFACQCGRGGWLTKFLGLPVFAVLSRLTYSAFLIHWSILPLLHANTEVTWHFQAGIEWFSKYLASIIVTYFFAAIAYLVIELPLMNLTNKLLLAERSNFRTAVKE